jgi:hypothetical protein
MITTVNPIEVVSEWRMLVQPEKKFSNMDQVSFFNDMLIWFVERCLKNEQWMEYPETVHGDFVTIDLSADECLSVLNHFELYVSVAGCNFSYVGSSSAGMWKIGING